MVRMEVMVVVGDPERMSFIWKYQMCLHSILNWNLELSWEFGVITEARKSGERIEFNFFFFNENIIKEKIIYSSGQSIVSDICFLKTTPKCSIFP